MDGGARIDREALGHRDGRGEGAARCEGAGDGQGHRAAIAHVERDVRRGADRHLTGVDRGGADRQARVAGDRRSAEPRTSHHYEVYTAKMTLLALLARHPQAVEELVQYGVIRALASCAFWQDRPMEDVAVRERERERESERARET